MSDSALALLVAMKEVCQAQQQTLAGCDRAVRAELLAAEAANAAVVVDLDLVFMPGHRLRWAVGHTITADLACRRDLRLCSYALLEEVFDGQGQAEVDVGTFCRVEITCL